LPVHEFLFIFSQGELAYELIGDYPSGSFFQVNRTTGLIELVRDLRMDSLRTKEYTVCKHFHFF